MQDRTDRQMETTGRKALQVIDGNVCTVPSPGPKDTITSKPLRHMSSCPALYAQSSDRLHSICEQSSILEDAEHAEELDREHQLAALRTAIETDSIYLSSQQPPLSKKRSFLLVDVLENVEGRPAKKQECQNVILDKAASGTTTLPQAISVYGSARRIKRQLSDFDLLYASSKSRKLDPIDTTRTREEERVEEQRPDAVNREQTPLIIGTEDNWLTRGRQLRSKKSMIAMSLERAKAISPSRHRLDDIDTDQITSFDALLQIPVGFKSDPCGPMLVRDSTSAIRFQDDGHEFTTGKARRPVGPAETTGMTQRNPRLRHVKSAKDILGKYSTLKNSEGNSSPSKDIPTNAPESGSTHESKNETREVALRRSLRGLLGLKKKRAK